jgi:RimJ/RimL family protein N-acetyltransferase
VQVAPEPCDRPRLAGTDESLITRAILVDNEVVGTIGSWGDPDEREVTYWIGCSYWGKRIATRRPRRVLDC